MFVVCDYGYVGVVGGCASPNFHCHVFSVCKWWLWSCWCCVSLCMSWPLLSLLVTLLFLATSVNSLIYKWSLSFGFSPWLPLSLRCFFHLFSFQVFFILLFVSVMVILVTLLLLLIGVNHHPIYKWYLFFCSSPSLPSSLACSFHLLV
jgi:hypothetical protein